MKEIAVDTETTGRDFFHGCGPFMVTACDGESNYCWTGEVNPYDRGDIKWSKSAIKEIQNLMINGKIIGEAGAQPALLMHNAKFDVRALSTIGIQPTYWDRLEDTLIASHVCSSGEPHGLKGLAYKYLGYENEGQVALKKAVLKARQENPDYDLAKEGHPTMPGEGGPGTRWNSMDYWLCVEECTKYGIDDVEMTWLLWQFYKDVLEHIDSTTIYKERKALLKITYEMQSNGMYTYVDDIRTEIRIQKALRTTLSERIHKEVNIANDLNFDNESDLSFLLFHALGLEPSVRSEKTEKPLMNKDVIKGYLDDNPDILPLQHLKDYRRAGTKISYMSSYLKWVDNNNRIHSDLLITGTRETRQASRNPNTQNIDKDLAHIFGPPPGKVWLIYDLVNIELRIWGYEVGNKDLIQIFEDRRSYHNEVARLFYPKLVRILETNGEKFKNKFPKEYGKIKGGNFNVIYGGGEWKVNNTYDLVDERILLHTLDPEVYDLPEDPDIPNAYRKIIKVFPEVSGFTASKIAEVFKNNKEKGYPFIECLGGYRLDVNPDQIYTTACNYFCQGSAGYTIGLCMQEVDKNPDYIATKAQMVNQVHDSLYIEIDIEHNTPKLQESLKLSIEKGGERLLPTCEAELEAIIYHPDEKPQ